MKTPTELAEERARAVVRDRGAGHEPLTWEEIEALLSRVRPIRSCDRCGAFAARVCHGCADGVLDAAS